MSELICTHNGLNKLCQTLLKLIECDKNFIKHHQSLRINREIILACLCFRSQIPDVFICLYLSQFLTLELSRFCGLCSASPGCYAVSVHGRKCRSQERTMVFPLKPFIIYC